MKMCQCLIAIIFLCIISTLTCDVNAETSQNRLSNDVVPKIYDLFFRIDLKAFVFSGTAAIDVHTNRAVKMIQMHNIGLAINGKVAVNSAADNSLKAESINIMYDNSTEIMNIELDRMLLADSDFRLILSFSGVMHNDMKGLYISSYYEGGDVKYIATTFSAAAYARKIFPCFDEPNFKAKYRLKIACHKDFIAIANTKAINTKNEDDWTITQFEESLPMATYIVAFSVCDFKHLSIGGEPEFSGYASSKVYMSMEFGLKIGQKALKALEEYTGQPYPMNKMDFIAVDDFLYGAMENWGFNTYKSSRILYEEGKRNHVKMRGISTLISHELTHQFFGNLVTQEYWDYVWLNEGFATYIQYIIADKILPDWRILEHFTTQEMHKVMVDDVIPKTHPMTRAVNTPEEIEKIYDFVAYPKAACVIRMIEHVMTPNIFKIGIRRYMDERKYSTATDEQLYKILEATRKSNGVNLHLPSIVDIFRSWSRSSSYPILNVRYLKNEGIVRVSQEMFYPALNETGNSQFIIPFNLITSDNVDAPNLWSPEFSQWYVLYGAETIDIKISGNPEWIMANLQQTGYYRVNYDKNNWDEIRRSLNNYERNHMHILNRAQVLDDCFNLAISGYLNFTKCGFILKNMQFETELMPIAAVSKITNFLLTHFDDQPFYEEMKYILNDVLENMYIQVKHNHTRTATLSKEYHAIVKQEINTIACRVFEGSRCVEDVNENKNFDTQVDVDDRQYIYCGRIMGKQAETHWKTLWYRLSNVTASIELTRYHEDEIGEILYAITYCNNDLSRAKELLMDLLSKERVLSNDHAMVVIGNLIRVGHKHRDLVLDFYDEHYDAVNDTVSLTSILKIFEEAINTEKQSKRLKELGAKYAVNIGETMRQIEKNIYWMKIKTPEVAAWVEIEKGAAIKLNLSIITIIFSISLMFFQ